MKINIIGLSGSGKTTLANKLSRDLEIKYTELDSFYYKYDPLLQKAVEASHSEFIFQISQVTKSKSWIIEGVYPIKEVFKSADIIVWLKPHFTTSLLRQWRRFLNDKEQREKYGFKNNVGLSMRTLKLYFGNPDIIPDKVKNTPLKKVARILDQYKEKLYILSSAEQIDNFVRDINSRKTN